MLERGHSSTINGPRGRGVRPAHGVAVVATVVLAAIIAFWVLSAVVGVIAFVIKFLVVAAILVLAARFVIRLGRK
jgi:hypothetical protein